MSLPLDAGADRVHHPPAPGAEGAEELAAGVRQTQEVGALGEGGKAGGIQGYQ